MFNFISKSLTANTNEISKSSVLKPFYTSWTIINWKFLITLALSNNPISQRLVAADEHMSIWTGLYLPLIATASYIIFYPWLTYIASLLQRFPKECQRLGEIKSENKFIKAKNTNLDQQAKNLEKEESLLRKQEILKVSKNNIDIAALKELP